MPDTLVFGNVPYPTVTPRHLPASNVWVQENAPTIPEAVFWHRMIGTLWGTDGWFFGDNAATAYGIGVGSIDGADDAGRIIEWMSPESRYYGESSGPAVAPYGDGAALIAKVGVGQVNRVSKAIEISGNYETPLDEAARAAIVNLTAYFADQRRIPWDSFPMVPGEGRSFVCWHNEITGMAYKACPGSVVMAETPALIARVKAVLKQYQTVGKPTPVPTYAAPILPPWWDAHLEQSYPPTADWQGMRYRAIRFRAEAVKATVRRAYANAKADKAGPNVKVREKVFVERIVEKGTDGKQWFVLNEGTYVLASAFTPRISVRAR